MLGPEVCGCLPAANTSVGGMLVHAEEVRRHFLAAAPGALEPPWAKKVGNVPIPKPAENMPTLLVPILPVRTNFIRRILLLNVVNSVN
jgi:hypothetical protein